MTVQIAKDGSSMSYNRASPIKRAANYLKGHNVSLGVFLAAYGVFYLSVVIMGGWTLSDWGRDVFACPSSAVNSLLSRSYISPIFFLTSLPALLIGTAMLCVISIQQLRSGTVIDEHIAIVLTAFGFAYQVVGAWPLQNVVDMPWEWQKQIMSYGSMFAWMLYSVSWVALTLGVTSLYVHSRMYHKKYGTHSPISE
jgi:hypothetical protein